MTDQEMLSYNFFADDKDCDGIRNHTTRVVVTRKEHTCFYSPDTHPIPPGTRARLDEAVVDGEWKRFYSCEPCHEKGSMWP
jgi:hypothetical protein